MAEHNVDSSIPLPPDVSGGPMPASIEDASSLAPVVQGRFAVGDEGYLALVWRRFRRSVIGMIGLVLVLALIIMAIFADSFAPMDPKDQTISFAPPDNISFQNADGSFSLLAVESSNVGRSGACRSIRSTAIPIVTRTAAGFHRKPQRGRYARRRGGLPSPGTCCTTPRNSGSIPSASIPKKRAYFRKKGMR